MVWYTTRQQLNFYSFRKIKYADTLRIDPQLEAQTANYWRFRHENFRRGRPDLLSEIKRMNAAKVEKKESTAAVATVPVVAAVDSEVQALKKRLEEMNKNIDQLTAMVEKVNLKQEEHEMGKEHEQAYEQAITVGNKRKKVVLADPIPEPEPVGSFALEPVLPMSAHSSSEHMALDDLATMPPAPTFPLPDPAPMSTVREMSTTSNITDTEFVDQLLTQFDDDNDMEYLTSFEEPPKEMDGANDNRPDPELMQRLSDALMLLPKNIQEMIVERLIQSITSPDFEKNVVPKPQVSSTPRTTPEEKPSAVPVEMDADKQREVAVPLAAATLAALLQHLCQHAQGDEKIPNKNISKILPVVPVHA